MEQELIVDIKGLVKHYGSVKAVEGIDLEIPKGTIFGFLGPNGAGKSTTINILITLLKPTAGTGTIAGFDFRDSKNIRQIVGTVFQEQTLDEILTARQNLMLHGELYNMDKNVLKQKIDDLSKLVELYERLDEKVMNFSGGMRRRLEIVRGLMTNPQILFLDEPTIGLDPQSRANLREQILQLKEEKQLTIFLTTHDMEEAEELCDQICIIDHGKIIVKGTAEDLKNSLGSDIIYISLREDVQKGIELISKLDSVIAVKLHDDRIQVACEDGSKTLVEVIQMLGENNITIKSVEVRKPTLNEVFLYYTGREIRDEEIDLADRLKMVGRKPSRRMGMRG